MKTVGLDEKVHKDVKHRATDEGKTIEQIVHEALCLFLYGVMEEHDAAQPK